MVRYLCPALCAMYMSAIQAVESSQGVDPSPPVLQPVIAGAAPAVPVPSNWTRKGVIGIFLSNTTTSNAEQSRDATIGGTSSSSTVSGKLDAGLEWVSGKNSVENLLKAEYGRQRQRQEDWIENKDELRYDGVYRRSISKPSFVYLSWGFETVFTGSAPTYDALQPFLAKGGTGYGQLWENILPEKDRFEWRFGARAQKRWGRYVSSDQDGIETGMEGFARYERQAIIKHDDQDLRYYVQYEGFSEFNDVSHVTNLFTAGLTYQLTKYLTLDLAIRAFYETRPKEDQPDHQLAGYSQWSTRQDTLLGIAYTF